METTFVRNHDHLDWDAVRQCESVRNLSRFTPPNKGDFEPPESMLARADGVADGMKVVMQQLSQIIKEEK
jgi:hypothetical protein